MISGIAAFVGIHGSRRLENVPYASKKVNSAGKATPLGTVHDVGLHFLRITKMTTITRRRPANRATKKVMDGMVMAALFIATSAGKISLINRIPIMFPVPLMCRMLACRCHLERRDG